MSPPLISNFKRRALDKAESAYFINKTASLGKSPDCQLPAGIDKTHACFGVVAVKGDSVAMAISPQRTTEELDEEYDQGKELYKKVFACIVLWAAVGEV